MRTFSRWMAVATLVCGVTAHADNNDIRLERLGNPDSGEAGYRPEANGNFQAFARTMGAVISSANLMPPETLGHAAFAVNAELSTVGVSGDLLPTVRPIGSNPLLVPSIHVRKGLPFSLELGARLGWIDRSEMFMATGELKAAVNEGFTWLPDVGVRLHATRLFNQRYFDLTAAGLDFGVGKQFAVGGMVTFTPYGGLDLVGVAASSKQLDFDPGRDPSTTLESRDAGLTNTAAYRPLSLTGNVNTRFYGGVRFIGGPIQLGAELSHTSLGSLTAEQNGGAARDLPAVTAFNATLGLDF